jgi:hypothetical protein
VRLNFGLAVRNPDDPEHFRYICPGRWGEAERVPDIATTPEGALVVPLEDAVWIGDAEGLSFLRAEAPDWRAQTLLGHALGTRTTLVTRDATGARLWECGRRHGSGHVGRHAARRHARLGRGGRSHGALGPRRSADADAVAA